MKGQRHSRDFPDNFTDNLSLPNHPFPAANDGHSEFHCPPRSGILECYGLSTLLHPPVRLTIFPWLHPARSKPLLPSLPRLQIHGRETIPSLLEAGLEVWMTDGMIGRAGVGAEDRRKAHRSWESLLPPIISSDGRRRSASSSGRSLRTVTRRRWKIRWGMYSSATSEIHRAWTRSRNLWRRSARPGCAFSSTLPLFPVSSSHVIICLSVDIIDPTTGGSCSVPG